ncbi:LysM peptidoglycan-binding domain-containing protein [Nonlabens xiamenensis]|uniref:LysM peptidoglycan-binding domain-containing protein n=1 Tax=Nonlabens xiamenensis TaxID=2341043 RepID=UPI0013DE291E|nr:LysM peptidoglycan-binding domain-containing protein [Nonlabens xiamenensis]
MKNLLIVMLVCFAFAKADAAFLQNYKQHKVAQGETIYTLTKTYDVTAKQLLDLNPDLKSGLKYGMVLLIPEPKEIITSRKVVRYKSHKVKRKETLFGLAEEYGVTQLDIKEANKQLYSSPLQKGDKIKIPVFEEVTTSIADTAPEVVDRTNLPDGKYVVRPSEGWFRIATNHGIKIQELKAMNPKVTELRPGTILNVPKGIEIAEADNDADADTNPAPVDKFVDYTIPKSMGMYSLKNIAGISEDSLIALNPALNDGLKEGMVIRIPNPNLTSDVVLLDRNREVARLVDSLRNFEAQRIAVLLPFSLQQINEETTDRDRLKEDRTLRIALDFYSGMQIARDSARNLGINVQFDVYDTQKNLQQTKDILDNNNFRAYSAVIGPLMSTNALETAKALRQDGIPVISPLSTVDQANFENYFQARPNSDLLKSKLKVFLKTYAQGKNVIIVTDNNEPGLKNEFANLLPEAKLLIPNEKKNYIFNVQYVKELDPERENVVVLAVDNVGFVTDAVSSYAAKADTHRITMFGLEAFEEMELSNMRLAALHYTYPQMFNDGGADNEFKTAYFQKFAISPNAYATRGFDLSMDVFLRQASAEDLYESVVRNGKTVMTENKFEYLKKPGSGYFNNAVYILQYQEDLSIKELEMGSPGFTQN